MSSRISAGAGDHPCLLTFYYNLAILYLTKLADAKFSNFTNLSIDVINKPYILQVYVWTTFSEKNKNIKIAKFSSRYYDLYWL